MKTLLLNRHAKSSWDNSRLSDFDRPLNDRGENDAPEMAKRLLDKQQAIDLIISSPANRALSTAQIFAETMNLPLERIRVEKDIYLASTHTLLQLVNRIEGNYNRVILFGHNPGITDFANYLTGDEIANIPTCGIVKINFDTDQWSLVSRMTGTLKFFDYPKSL